MLKRPGPIANIDPKRLFSCFAVDNQEIGGLARRVDLGELGFQYLNETDNFLMITGPSWSWSHV